MNEKIKCKNVKSLQKDSRHNILDIGFLSIHNNNRIIYLFLYNKYLVFTDNKELLISYMNINESEKYYKKRK